MHELKSILSAKMILLIPREKFRKSFHLANFCIFFTDENLLQNINLLNVRTDFTRDTKDQVNTFAKENREINHFIFQSDSQE